MYYSAPTYNIDTKEWSTTDFETRKDVVDFIDDQFKYPGEYNLKYSDGYWNEQGKIWQKTKSYPKFVKKSIDFRRHWDLEREKCAFEGFIIYKSESENLCYAVPGLYYFYLNYCPIMDKVKKSIDLAEIYDGDYHYFLYILRCILHRKYGAVLKKRQAGYTLKNMSILINAVWFIKAAVSKIFASDITKVQDSWKHMEIFRDHLNKYTGWNRGLDPNKSLDWQLRRKTKDGSYTGKMSIAKGFTTGQKPTNGVGGNATVIFGEEAGINATLHKTHEYITSNVSLGGLTTGLIIYSGAVGELDYCEPLKEFILNPIQNQFLACRNVIEDDFEFGEYTGFFAPEWWNYVSVDDFDGSILKCFDRWGNSNKELALQQITKSRLQAKEKKDESYRYFCSQRPLSIKEAFAFRKDAYFPQDIVGNQINRVTVQPPTLKEVVLFENEHGQISWRSRRDNESKAITKFPLGEKDDKRGCVVIKEFPPENPKKLVYFAGVDDIATGKSTTSDSLFSIIIFKNIKEIKYEENGEVKTRVEGNEPVAWYTGRLDDMAETHKIAEYLIRYYNAFAAIENNVQNFINHMQTRGLQHYMATKEDMPFIKEMGQNQNVFRAYGVYIAANGTVKEYLLANAKQYVTEIMDRTLKEDGEVVKTTYGIERISDMGLLNELQKYYPGLNTDRLIAFMLAQSIAKAFQVTGIIEREDKTSKAKEVQYASPQKGYFKMLDADLNPKTTRSYFKKHG